MNIKQKQVLLLFLGFFMMSCGKETERLSLSAPVENNSRVVSINQTTIKINLVASPKLPFHGTSVESHIGDGWAILEKRADGLYVNDQKVILHLSNHQMNGRSLNAYDIRKNLTVLNANILDALVDNPHLIPEDWKKNKGYIFFLGTLYRGYDAHHHLYVRFLYLENGMWERGRTLLSYYYGGNYTTALL